MHLFLMSKVLKEYVIDTLKNAFISHNHVGGVERKENHLQYIKDANSGFLL